MMPSGCERLEAGQLPCSPAERRMGGRLARYLFVNNERLGIDYLIWQDHIRNPGEHADENAWRTVGLGDPTTTTMATAPTPTTTTCASVYSSSVNAWMRPPRGNPEGHGERPCRSPLTDEEPGSDLPVRVSSRRSANPPRVSSRRSANPPRGE